MTDSSALPFGRVPVIAAGPVRMALGAVLALAAAYLADRRAWTTRAGVLIVAWAVSVWLTDKYAHKYPRRYVPYLLAAHGKAAVVLLVIAMLLGWVAGLLTVATWRATVMGVAGFVVADFTLS